MKFNTYYSKHNDPIAHEDGVSMTDQQYKDQCDIAFMVSQYAKLGVPIPQSPVSYADLTDVQTYEEALMTVSEYKSAFELLPSADRERFHGSVSEYLSFISNQDNLKESIEKNYIDPSSVSEEILDTLFSKTDISNPVSDLQPVNPQPVASASTNENVAS